MFDTRAFKHFATRYAERLILNQHGRDASNRAGVYFLLNKSEIVYIGQSVDPESRVLNHWREANPSEGSYTSRQAKDFDAATVLRVGLSGRVLGQKTFTSSTPVAKSALVAAPKGPLSELDVLEGALIRHYKPKFNGMLNTVPPRIAAPSPCVEMSESEVLARLCEFLGMDLV